MLFGIFKKAVISARERPEPLLRDVYKRQAPFGVEDWLNVHEKSATYDIAQSTIASMTLDELVALGAPRGLVADAAEAAFLQDARAGAAQMGFFARLGAEKMNYGWIEGSPAFKRAAAALYGRVEPEAVLQTNGATGANLLAVLALVSRGDHVVAEYPSYQQLYDIPRALGAEVDLWRIYEDRGWYPDLGELERLVRPDTRLICLNNANNPTGTFLDLSLIHISALGKARTRRSTRRYASPPSAPSPRRRFCWAPASSPSAPSTPMTSWPMGYCSGWSAAPTRAASWRACPCPARPSNMRGRYPRTA